MNRTTKGGAGGGRRPDLTRRAGILLRQGATLALAAGLAGPAGAAEYDVEHNFRLRPGGNVVPRVTAYYYAHSFIQERRGDCADFAVAPAQGAVFNPYGRDILRNRRGRVRNRGVDGRYRDVTNGSTAVPAAGFRGRIDAFTVGCLSWADANCDIDVDPFAAGGQVTGTIRAWGEARAALRPPRRSKAYAFSMTLVEAQGGRMMRNGNIRWRRAVRDIVAGRAGERRQVDPIDYTVTDLVTGEVHTGTLYSVLIDVLKSGGGGFRWENDTVEISAREVDFKVEFPSALTSRQGVLDLQVRNGVVTVAHATGHYAGVLPPVGTQTPLSFALEDDEEFDYDLGDFDGHDLDVNLEFSGAGEAVEEKAADPELTVMSVTDDSGSPAVMLTWPAQNCPVVVQQWTSLTEWNDLPPMTLGHENGMHGITLPLQADRGEFFRLRTIEDEVTDIDPPKFVAEGLCGEPMVLINFTEPVDPALAQDPFFYLIQGEFGESMPVLDAQMLAPDAVMLFLPQPLPVGLELPLQAVILGGISDLAGNEIRPHHAVPIVCEPGVPTPHDRDVPRSE